MRGTPLSASISTRSLSRVWRLRWWRVTSCLRIQVREGVGQKADQILDISSISSTSSTLHDPHSLSGCWWRVWIWQFIFVIKQNSLTQHQRGRPVAKTLLFARWSDSGLPGYELACSPHFFHFIQSGAANSEHAAHTIHKTGTLRTSALQFRIFHFLHRRHKWRTKSGSHLI